jgi:tetratricopeptide (TPR) repeat protein
MAAQGRLGEASDLFRRALRAAPEFAEAYESLGEALAQQGKKAEAVPYLREALRLMELRRRGSAQGPS